MANLASSKKDIRRIEKKTVFNDRIRARVKKAVKSFNTFVTAKDVEKAKEMLPRASKVIGKASQKKIIKKQTASRKISRLTIKLNNLITAQNVETAKKSA